MLDVNNTEITALVLIIVAGVQATKQVFPDLPTRYKPLVALAFSAFGGFFLFLSPLEVLIAAFIATGTYSSTKAIINN